MGSRVVAWVFSLTSAQLVPAMAFLDHGQRVTWMPCLWHIIGGGTCRAEGHERLLLVVVYVMQACGQQCAIEAILLRKRTV